MARHRWLLLCPAVALAVITMTVEAQQETGFLDRTVTIGGKPLRYQVYVPSDYTPAKRWPVILFLHGAGERGTDGIRQTEVGLGTAIRQNARWFPAIVVLPQAPPDSIWRGSVAQGALAALERSIREFHGDRTRLYLTGLSMGGYGVWTLALQRPALFAAIVAVCGGLLPPSHFTELEVNLGGPDPYAALARRLGGIPAWLFHGAADSVIPATESRQIHAAFQQAGSPVRYTEYPGVGHNSWDSAFSDPKLWEWLFAQRRAVR
ncbi:MAG: prolyl oligopeptidase family serine peptidase [Gemmatimonadota bacterium]|nr:prolyl oligopeptidase family serine peptidase [Gemmatimonadota bacterium]